MLEFLDTKPRTTYLARVRNPNPAMPDYQRAPLSLEEYSKQTATRCEQAMAQPARRADRAAAGEKGAH